jgi:hypothetical protein
MPDSSGAGATNTEAKIMTEPNGDPAGERARPGAFESLGRKLDERPEVHAAEEALRQAQEQFDRARKQYHEIRAQAAEGLHHIRDRNVGDLLSSTLELVRKYPGPGVLAALLCGWFAGRIFRR